MQRSRSDLNAKYTHFAPVGTTIKRKERTISFTEQNYLTNLKSYNDALLRKKNLEMTAAILKVLNPPAYPINEEVASRKKIVMMAAAGSFIFFVALFLLIEPSTAPCATPPVRANRLAASYWELIPPH